MKKSLTNLLLALTFILMLGFTISTSLESNLFMVFPELIKIPWFNATLVDFYLNQFIIYGIVLYLEDFKFLKTLPWLIVFICLGSMGSALYFLYYINLKNKGNLYAK